VGLNAGTANASYVHLAAVFFSSAVGLNAGTAEAASAAHVHLT
jgi:hypothetical protein